ncbi:unnamed protein product [Amoebophrya sp. A120]|nr:unnamed protein product [Amoebophrya sp. A120]|eukprot:GSA120T00014574001.1
MMTALAERPMNESSDQEPAVEVVPRPDHDSADKVATPSCTRTAPSQPSSSTVGPAAPPPPPPGKKKITSWFDFPPFFTLQPNLQTQQRQLELWAERIVDSCWRQASPPAGILKSASVSSSTSSTCEVLFASGGGTTTSMTTFTTAGGSQTSSGQLQGATTEKLFHNPSINRKVAPELFEAIADYMCDDRGGQRRSDTRTDTNSERGKLRPSTPPSSYSPNATCKAERIFATVSPENKVASAPSSSSAGGRSKDRSGGRVEPGRKTSAPSSRQTIGLRVYPFPNGKRDFADKIFLFLKDKKAHNSVETVENLFEEMSTERNSLRIFGGNHDQPLGKGTTDNGTTVVPSRGSLRISKPMLVSGLRLLEKEGKVELFSLDDQIGGEEGITTAENSDPDNYEKMPSGVKFFLS